MAVSNQEIEHLAELARLNLTADEVSRLSHELGEILKYIDKIKEVADQLKNPSKTAADNHWRADEVKPFTKARELINRAPRLKKNLLVVPPVFED